LPLVRKKVKVEMADNVRPSSEHRGTLKLLYYFLVKRRDLTLILIILVASLIVTRITPYFLTLVNMRTLGLAIAFNAIVAIGMTILLISGGIDISVGANYGLSSIIVGLLIAKDFSPLPGILIGLAVGTAVGGLNALLVNRFGLSPFLATIGMMSVCRGMIWLVSGGHSIVGLPPTFLALGQTKLLGVQLPVYIMLGLILLMDFLVRRSRFFRQMYYIGINRESARTCGIPVARVTGIAYMMTGFLAALAGILDGARVGAVYVMAGTGLEFQVITAAIIGGAALTGGKGTILGSLLGAAIMAILTNVLNLVGVNMYWQNVMVGLILIAVVALDQLLASREA
jgi:ribose transport system permease protein